MEKKTLEIEADSVDEAYALAEHQVPEGFAVTSRRVISDGGTPKEAKGVGTTEQEAESEARKAMPKSAFDVNVRIENAPEHRKLTVEAFEENEARTYAQKELSSGEQIQSVSVLQEGSKGFLGLFKKPHT